MSVPFEIMVVAGEASGDQHASELLAALKRRRPELHAFGMGGTKLAAAGLERLHDAADVSVMGISEVLPRLPRILGILSSLSRAARDRGPRLAVLVDIPDFNLRLAKKLKRLGIPVVYYISPMIWAWRRGRVRKIAKVVDTMLCILPFEVDFYRGAGVRAVYVGSPVVEQVPAAAEPAAFRARLGLAPGRPTLALLPGSRMSEIERLLPDMVKSAELMEQERPGLQVVVPVAPTIARETVTAHFEGSSVKPVLVDGHAPEVVGASDAAIVASGTAALEAGLMQRPFVVVYRVSLLTYWVGRLMLKVAHVALVNLLAGRRLVPELLQQDFEPTRVRDELTRLWTGEAREELVRGLREVRQGLGPPGAAERAADEVLRLLSASAPVLCPRR